MPLAPGEWTPSFLRLYWEAGGWEVLWTVFTVPSLRPGLDFPLGDSRREPQDWTGLFNEVATSVCFLPAALPASLSSQIIETPRRGFLSPWQARVGVAGALPLAQALVITGTPLGCEPTPTSAEESNCISSFVPAQGSHWERPPDLAMKGQGFLKRRVGPDLSLLILTLSGPSYVLKSQ